MNGLSNDSIAHGRTCDGVIEAPWVHGVPQGMYKSF